MIQSSLKLAAIGITMSIKQYWKHGLLTIALLAIIGFTFSAAMADMADYYVSPTGNDGNDGLSPETAVLIFL